MNNNENKDDKNRVEYELNKDETAKLLKALLSNEKSKSNKEEK